jgi:tetratricopeptide (TPR) repeat protein
VRMSDPRPRLAAIGALALCLAALAPAAAQPSPPVPAAPQLSDAAELERAITLWEAGQFDDCVEEFRTLLGDGERRLEQADVVERARVYLAACLIASGKEAEAEEQFRQAIRQNPQMRTPDSLLFPPVVIDRFVRVKFAMREEIAKAEEERIRKAREAAERAAREAAAERARVRRLEEYARQELIVTKNRRGFAMVPFGVGQFQNGDTTLGWLFLGTELALAGTALTALIIELELNAQRDDTPRPDPEELFQAQSNAHTVLVVSSWGFIAVAVAGIVQAQIAFQPEFRERKRRPLPKEVRPPPEREVSLSASPLALPGGLGFGLTGQF